MYVCIYNVGWQDGDRGIIEDIASWRQHVQVAYQGRGGHHVVGGAIGDGYVGLFEEMVDDSIYPPMTYPHECLDTHTHTHTHTHTLV
jgi:hypothetical protein